MKFAAVPQMLVLLALASCVTRSYCEENAVGREEFSECMTIGRKSWRPPSEEDRRCKAGVRAGKFASVDECKLAAIEARCEEQAKAQGNYWECMKLHTTVSENTRAWEQQQRQLEEARMEREARVRQERMRDFGDTLREGAEQYGRAGADARRTDKTTCTSRRTYNGQIETVCEGSH